LHRIRMKEGGRECLVKEKANPSQTDKRKDSDWYLSKQKKYWKYKKGGNDQRKSHEKLWGGPNPEVSKGGGGCFFWLKKTVKEKGIKRSTVRPICRG